MRRLLLATTAITALALVPALALAQTQPNGLSGAIQEQPSDQQHKPPQGGKPVTPTPRTTTPGKSAQTETLPAPQQPQQPQRLPGQTQPQPQAPSGQQRVQGQTPPSGPQHVQGQPQQPTTGAQQRPAATTGTSGGARIQVQVTEQQRTQIHERLAHFRVERIEHPQFSVSVGVVIPSSVRIVVLPPEIVEIVPQYAGFDYVVVGDEIVIIDPGSLLIVAVIPA